MAVLDCRSLVLVIILIIKSTYLNIVRRMVSQLNQKAIESHNYMVTKDHIRSNVILHLT